MDHEPWLNDFLASFPAPEAEESFIQKVKLQVKQEVRAKRTKLLVLPKKFWLYVFGIFVATLPIFSLANYFYYLTLKYFITLLFPQLMTFLVLIFLCSVTLIGALCYAAIPIWAAVYWKNTFVAKVNT